MTIDEILMLDPNSLTLETHVGGKHGLYVAQLAIGSEPVEEFEGCGGTVVEAIDDLATTLTAAGWKPEPTY